MSKARVTTTGVHQIRELTWVKEELGTGGPETAPEEVKKGSNGY